MEKLQFSRVGAIFIISLSIFITSCQKETNLSEEKPSLEEGFMSTTSNADALDIEEENETLELAQTSQVLHMNFKAGTSKEEIDKQWRRAVKQYHKENAHNRLTSHWHFEVRTVTGTGPIDDTDGLVRTRVIFDTNTNRVTTGNIILNNPGNDREQGDTDLYAFQVSGVGLRTTVGLRSARIQLRGTDGWFPTAFDVTMHSDDEIVIICPTTHTAEVTGASSITTTPNVFLDNSLPFGWDTFNSGNIGTGDVFWACFL